MSEKIKVKIIEGVIAKEVNLLGENMPDNFRHYLDDLQLANASSKSNAEQALWQEAEAKLRTFEIDLINSSDKDMKPHGKKYWWQTGQILTAHISEIYDQPKNGINGQIIIL